MTESLPRAFLSHSSIDKDFVSAVANRLGRHQVIYDVMHFKSGIGFVEQIESYVKSSEVFVFFASPNSLKSFWCSFEIEQAKLALIQRLLQRSVTYVISNKVTIPDLPKWLQQTKVLFRPGVGQVVRDIDHHLMSLLPTNLQPSFVGRNTLRDGFLESLVGGQARKFFIFAGLESIGRRSYGKKVLEENLGLQPGPTFHVDQLTGPENLYAQLLLDGTGISQSELKRDLETYNSLTIDQQLDELAAKMNAIVGPSEYPILIDQKGITDQSGIFNSNIVKLVDKFVSQFESRYVVSIHRFRPKINELPFANVTTFQQVPPLTKVESVGLLRRLLAKTDAKIDENQMLVCAEMSDGYPPAIIFIAHYIEKYGYDVLVNAKEDVEALKRKVFIKFLRDLKLDGESITILKYLSREGSLSFDVVKHALGLNSDSLASHLRNLIDLSLVNYDASRYTISWPIRDSVIRNWGDFPSTTYRTIAINIARYIEELDGVPDIDTIDAVLAAQVRGGIDIDWSASQLPLLPSSVIKLAERSYHLRDYERSLELSQRALKYAKGRNQQNAALHTQLKSLVNLQRWPDADGVLKQLDDMTARDRFYLRGFMLRKKHLWADALEQYEKAILIGHNPNSVLRDCADCLFRLGRFAEAITRIKQVRERDPDNPWVLDLLARCCIDAGDEAGFKDALADLKIADVGGQFWRHREASYLAKRRKFADAYALACAACENPQAPFECFSTRADIAIELGNYDLAKEHLESLKEKFRRVRVDVQNGLWCKYCLSQKKWEEALSFYELLTDKSLLANRFLKIRILETKARDINLPLADRNRTLKEIEILKRDNVAMELVLAEDSDARVEDDI